MPAVSEKLRGVKNFTSLISYLRIELHWPIETDNWEDLTFEYDAEELGLQKEYAHVISKLWQLRPLDSRQPWGIFFVEFKKKQLPIVVLRRILRGLVIKKRASAKAAEKPSWAADDLLFISALGDEKERELTFAHFKTSEADLPTLRVLGWDGDDTFRKLEYLDQTLHQHFSWPEDTSKPKEWLENWSEPFRHRPGHTIRTAKELAEALAGLAIRIRDAAKTVMKAESEKGKFRTLHKAFKESLIHDLEPDDFADTYAQTITYGLLTAAISRTDMSAGSKGTAVIVENVADMVPITNPFLKEILQEFLLAGGRKGKLDFDELGVQDVAELLRGDDTDLPAVIRDFGNQTRGEDPVIHFYEHFLAAYDKAQKKQRGVFYTPQPVVSYIVRSVHELLQTEFGLADGLADTSTWGEMLKKHPGLKLPALTDEAGEKRTISPEEPFVQILDPATGTATFLVEVIDVIHKTLSEKWVKEGLTKNKQIEAWNDYVPKHLLPRLHAFELMMAPYAIAHMKIGLKLAETGYRFGNEERARIYLTNALEPKVKQLPQIGFDALAHEAAAVNEIKWYKRFTVVIGNPPYAIGSENRAPWILSLLSDYKENLNEKKLNLDDDYIKFIRLGEHLAAEAGCGVLGVITNNSFLDGLVHRAMRGHLLNTYPSFDVVDLHGSTVRRERTPDGGDDENVFDIQQGVSLTLAWRAPQPAICRVRHGELWGTRASKYKLLSDSMPAALTSVTLSPNEPYWFFEPKDFTQATGSDYLSWISISDVFGRKDTGIQTKKDALSIGWSISEVLSRAERFNELSSDKARSEFQLGDDSSGWSISKAKADLREAGVDKRNIHKILYRPFDLRWIYYTKKSGGFIGRPRWSIMQHLVGGTNVALIATRQYAAHKHFVMLCSNQLTEMSSQPYASYVLHPLYHRSDERDLLLRQGQQSNLTNTIVTKCEQLDPSITPQDIFHYAYAVFHSPDYRSRYAEFLKIDFPRLPLTGNLELFRVLARIGGELTSLHLLESPKLAQPITEFIGGRHPEVEKISWSRGTVWVDKAETTGFQGVREEVWNFHIGGYQVCEKWLKDRKTRKLSKDDITHYEKVVVALSETIRLMKEIDEVIEKAGGWPGAFVASVQAPKESPIQVEERSASGSPPLQESLSLVVEPTTAVVPADNPEAEQNSKPAKTRVSSTQDDDKPVRINETEQNEVLCTIRQMFSEGLELSRELAFKKIAKELGYDRVGSKIEETLDSDIRTAVKRGILENERGTLKLLCKTIEGYEREFLKDQFLASIGRPWVERDEAVRAFTRFMGFRRAGEKIQDTVRSLINGLLREDRLESDGQLIRRKS